jgi:hypothetical protein
VLYLCDTAVRPAAVYRNLAAALGLVPRRSRDALWRQLRDTIVHLVDEHIVLDACDELRLERPSLDPTKSRGKRGTKSR